ncbi:uncharacterized protein LOC121381048 [Gigantopelta aegis]|uniref:uncharacterized protein LOC121381048 n=1 Tax=Gigantopelta aegis TaxID=1735272 RepID=UPI001B8893C7|nr:uncharacterized protein LOC121381048 [Gigantopelta aegis]
MASSATRTKENCAPRSKSKIPVSTKQKSKKVKPVPNFSKLHDEWNRKFEMGKACHRKCTTLVNEFDLTRPGTKFSHATVTENKENVTCFTPDMKSLHNIVSDKELGNSMTTGRATIATSRLHKQTKNRCAFSELACQNSPSKKQKVSSRLAHEQQQNGISFESDRAALKSIVSDEGIKTPQQAGRIMLAQTCFTSLQQAPRNSIYFQGQPRMSLYESLTQHKNWVKSRLGAQSSNVSGVKQEDSGVHSSGVHTEMGTSDSSKTCTDKPHNEQIQQSSTQLHSEQGCSTPKSTQSVVFRESPYVRGPIVEPMRQSIYVNVVHRSILTPTSASQRRPTCNKAKSTEARRVLNPNFKHMTPNNIYTKEESTSVKKIRKTLRWADILESPSTFKSPKQEPAEHLEEVIREASVVEAPSVAADDGTGRSRSEIRRPLYCGGESSSAAAVTHPPVPDSPAQHQPPLCSAHHSTPEPHTARRHADSALLLLHRTHDDISTDGGVDAAADHVLTAAAAGDSRCDSDDSYSTQIKVLDEQKRKIQSEMLQLKVAMEEERRGQVDSQHHHHQLAHHSINHLPHAITPVSHPPHHPVNPLQPHLAADNHPHLASSHLAMQTLPPFTPSAIPQPSFDLPSDIISLQSSLGNIDQPIEVSDVHLTIIQQLDAAKRKQEELAKIRLHLEQQLRLCSIKEQAVAPIHQTDNSSHASAGQPAGIGLVSPIAECNNNDLKDSVSCIPTECPPCRQEHETVDTGNINDNHCRNSKSSSSSQTAVTNEPENEMEVYRAGHDAKTEHVLMNTETSQASENVLGGTSSGGLEASDFSSTSWCRSHRKFKSRDSMFELVIPGQSKSLESVVPGQSKSLSQEENVQGGFHPADVEVPPDRTTDVNDQHSDSTSPSETPIESANVLTPDIFLCKKSANIVLPKPTIPQKSESRNTKACEFGKIAPPIWTPLALKVAASLTSSYPTSDVAADLPTSECASNTTCGEGVDLTSKSPSHMVTCVHSADLTRREDLNVNNNSDVLTTGVIPSHVHRELCKLGSLSLRANLTPSRCRIPEKTTTMFSCSLYMDALLDDEVAFFSCRLRTYFCDSSQDRGCRDPVAMTLSEGDDMHFVPVVGDGTHNGPLSGSAFSLY